ncbi:MAG: helix-turn-helix transcriptional regulator [bacterium]|nr:helix-turn-helix transcriptional regulator [bacterium]
MTFGYLLRRARLAAGVSQRELAQLIGVSSGYLSDVEHGRRRPLNTKRLHIAARRLGMTLLAATKAKASGDGFFFLATPLHHPLGMKVGALLALAWLDFSPADLVDLERICREALRRAGVDPDLPPGEG